MIDNPDDISTSGFVPASEYAISSQFSGHSELPSRGYSRLFKAQRNGQWFTLKTLKPEVANDPVYQGMLEKEFDRMMQLNHPNIVRVYSREEIPGVALGIVMEYVDGRTLGEFLKENPTRSVRESVARQLLEAIGYCHRKQIIHRDLKPSNVLVTYNGNRVKLIDFGLSDSDRYAVLKEPAFTKAYAAPEQLSGGEVDNRTDLYAFGLILKQLFPNRYGRVVRKCLQPKKENRYSSAEEVMKAMDFVGRWKKKSLWLVAILLIMGILVPVIVHQKNNSNPSESMDTKDLEETQSSLAVSDSRIDSTETTANVAPIMTKASVDEADRNMDGKMDMDMLDQYCYNLKFELDSIARPLDREIKKGGMYEEVFTLHLSNTFARMRIHVERQRAKLPKRLQTSYSSYANDMISRKWNTYPYKNAQGEELYPNCGSLYDKGKVSEAEYQSVMGEYKRSLKEHDALQNELKKAVEKGW
jgi:serine/threonine protein kinase